MKVAYCPYCNNNTLIDDRDWGRLVQCEGPRCEKFFTTEPFAEAERKARGEAIPKPPSEPLAVVLPPAPLTRFGFRDAPTVRPPFAKPKPQLTGPHRCHACEAEIHETFGKRRDTMLHHNPARPDNCRTDIYAALYPCPHCLASLETPTYQCGQEVTCPIEACKRTFIAPHDDVLHRIEGDRREGVAFTFDCPACQHQQSCDTLRHGKPTTGLPVVCTWCSQIILVPAGGSKLAERSGAVL